MTWAGWVHQMCTDAECKEPTQVQLARQGARDLGVFSTDVTAYFANREVYDVRMWKSVPLPASIPDPLWPGAGSFSSPYFVGPSLDAQSFLRFEESGAAWSFHLTDLMSGAELQAFTVLRTNPTLPKTTLSYLGMPQLVDDEYRETQRRSMHSMVLSMLVISGGEKQEGVGAPGHQDFLRFLRGSR